MIGGAPVRVLIADDQPVLRRALADLLRDEPTIEVVGEAGDAEETVALARRQCPNVVLLDVRMPAGGGMRAALELRRMHPAPRVVALSAYDDRATVLEMLRSGANGYLVKGSSGAEIVSTIHRVMRGEATLAAGITADVIEVLAERLERESLEHEAAARRHRRIRRVLDEDLVHVVLQPVMDVWTGEVCGVEALSRFAAPPPRPAHVWFAEAATVGLGTELELRSAAKAISHVQRGCISGYVAVNLTAGTLTSARLRSLLDTVDCSRLVLEVTEHAPVDDYEAFREAVRPLREAGCRLAVDDAGAGYSSLRHILRLEPDIIKLDRALTAELGSGDHGRGLAAAFTSLAAEVRATVVAEGVETDEELGALRALGINHAQGFRLAAPQRCECERGPDAHPDLVQLA